MRNTSILFFAVLILAAALRFSGLSRGESDFVPTGVPGTEVYYHFHPDEETLVRAALRLLSLFDPPLTAYGTLPMLLGRGVLHLSGLFHDGSLDADGRSRDFVYKTVRVFSALVSLATVALVFYIGRRHWGLAVAVLAASFTALVPIAVQQAHFYTVDGLFTLLALAALGAGMQAVASGRPRLLILAGVLVGLSAATRLNGLLLGAVLAWLFLLGRDLDWRNALARLKRSELWFCGLAALAALLVLEPYLLTAPEVLQRNDFSDDFGYSVQVARGEILRPWSLADMHTVPFLHYWTQLWPQAVGIPLTVLFALGLAYALWRREWRGLVLVCWCGLYFLTIGGLHTKHVRYLLPLLPGLSLLAAAFCVAVQRRWKWPALAATTIIALYTAAYGVAFAGIYRIEDSRIQAARWIFEHVPEGQNIGLESGGFSLRRLVDGQRYGKHLINSSRVFYTRGYLSCGTGVDYLRSRLDEAQYVVLIDVNRYRQYAAVPELFPVLHDFYTKLVEGELGFAPVQRFKIDPELWGIDFGVDRPEPSFYGYDHPAVLILQRRDDFEADWAALKWSLKVDPRCADGSLAAVASALQVDDLKKVEALITDIETRYPDMRLASLIAAYLHEKQGRPEAEQAALERYVSGFLSRSHDAATIPWAAGSSLIDVGLLDLARMALVDGANRRASLRPADKSRQALSYSTIADRLATSGETELAAAVYRMAAQVDPRPATYNTLAALSIMKGESEEALRWWETSLRLDTDQIDILRLAGKMAHGLGRYELALEFLVRAAELDSELSPAQRIAEYGSLMAEAEKVGAEAWAADLRARLSGGR